MKFWGFSWDETKDLTLRELTVLLEGIEAATKSPPKMPNIPPPSRDGLKRVPILS